MNFKKLVLVALALLVSAAFFGCAKKPRRPNPLDTVTGDGRGSNSGDYVSPLSMGDESSFIDGTRLEGRDPGSAEALAERGRRGVLPSIFFSFDSASILPEERPKLTSAAAYLASNPRAQLVLEGHCDWRGTTEYNLALGDRRAKSVEQFLASLNVAGDRLLTLSKGDLSATEGAASDQAARERRVELIVVD